MTSTEQPRMFQALRLLEKTTPPLLHHREPFWRPRPVLRNEEVLIPSWSWRGIHADHLPEGETPITVDINGAFLAALGAVQVAHGQLTHAGPTDAGAFRGPRYETSVWPGYYRIRVVSWALSATLVSPLGNTARLTADSEVWVAHPTLILLLELLAEGSIGDLTITDAWVAYQNRRVEFRDWSAELKKARNALLDTRAAAHGTDTPAGCTCEPCAQYAAFKEGYGAAFSMMLTGEKCQTHRPDWAHAVYAQHAAAAWRKAWRLSAIGPVLSMGSVDEITLLNADLLKAIMKPKPPVRWDPTGRTLGHVKRKEKPTQHADADTTEVYSEDWTDLI